MFKEPKGSSTSAENKVPRELEKLCFSRSQKAKLSADNQQKLFQKKFHQKHKKTSKIIKNKSQR